MGGRAYGSREQPLDGIAIFPQERVLCGVITEVDSTRNLCSVKLNDIAGQRTASIPVTMMNPFSWSRNIPLEGTFVLVAFRPGNVACILGYLDQRTQNNALNYAGGKNLFRDLVPGEYDCMTPGHAGDWGTIRGRLLQHGGAGSLFELDRDEMEARIDTAKFSVTTPAHFGGVTAQMRFGTVKRTIGDNRDTIICQEGGSIAEGDPDLQEFHVGVGWSPGASNPAVASQGAQLADLTLGHVVDSAGKEEKSRATTKDVKLRTRLRVYNTTGTETADAEIDENGNMYFQLPQTATIGFVTNILGGNFSIKTERGSFECMAKDDVRMAAGDSVSIGAVTEASISGNTGLILSSTVGDVNVTSGAGSVDVQGVGVNIGANKEAHMSAPLVSLEADGVLTLESHALAFLKALAAVVVTSKSIQLGGPTAMTRLVLDTFMPLFNAHTHSGVQTGSGTSGPPVTPMTEANLTKITKAI